MPRAVAPALAGALLFLVLHAPPSAAQAVVTIEATDDNFLDPRYQPFNVTAQAGAMLRIQNTGSDRHTFTSVDGAWEEVDVASGESASVAAPGLGSYKFYCRYHASRQAQPGEGMAGLLRVTSGPPAPPPTPPTTPTPLGPEVALLALALASLVAVRRSAR